MERLYYKYSNYLREKYGEKVYKLPINLDITCPNRDGRIGSNGCYFCSDIGTGFESLSNKKSVKEQLIENMSYVGKKYNANKFISYFQNYTNTYMDINVFEEVVNDACMENIVEVDISTRPDCINYEHLEVLHKLRETTGVDISIELGLQSSNERTLKLINRGHTVDDYINAVRKIKKYKFNLTTHIILNLPYDNLEDSIKTACLMNEVETNSVKLHSLYIARNSVFEKKYLDNEISMCSKNEYIERVSMFLAYLNEDISVQRLLARAPKEETLFCNWDESWWRIRDDIEKNMLLNNIYQGKMSNK